jgi:preprotein translocase SecE subunit
VTSARTERDDDEAPSPLAHATPDVELAEAQLALGRPDLADAGEVADEDDSFDEDDDYEQTPDVQEIENAARDGVGGRGAAAGGLVPAGSHAPEARGRPGNRLINFLQGSWRELQRVQWPDRRQVMQATGVVIGFVIVAGVFLGVADTLAGHVMNYILTGKW